MFRICTHEEYRRYGCIVHLSSQLRLCPDASVQILLKFQSTSYNEDVIALFGAGARLRSKVRMVVVVIPIRILPYAQHEPTYMSSVICILWLLVYLMKDPVQRTIEAPLIPIECVRYDAPTR